MKKLLILVLFGSLFVSACKKDEPTRTELLTGKNWRISAATVNPALDLGTGTPTSDFFALIPTCAKDNILNFSANGTVISDEGATKCDSNDPQTSSGTWVFKNTAQTAIVLTQGNDITEWIIDDINKTSFKYSFVEIVSGVSHIYTITMTHS